MQLEITGRDDHVLIRIVKIRKKMMMVIPNAGQRMWGNDDGHTNCWWEFKMDKAGLPRHVRAMGPRCLIRILRQKSWRLFSLLVYLYPLGKPTSLSKRREIVKIQTLSSIGNPPRNKTHLLSQGEAATESVPSNLQYLFFSKSSWNFSLVFLSMKLTTSISPKEMDIRKGLTCLKWEVLFPGVSLGMALPSSWSTTPELRDGREKAWGPVN